MSIDTAPPTKQQRLERLRIKLIKHGLLPEDENLLMQQMVQIIGRIDRAGGEFKVETLINKAGEGKVDATWGDVVFQLDVVKSREVAWMLLEAASVAEAEGMLLRFLRDGVHLELEAAGQMLAHFRKYREDAKVSTSLTVPDAQQH